MIRIQIPPSAPRKETTHRVASFLGIGRLNPSARGKSGFAPPVEEEATPLFPQRSKNARKSV